MTFFALPRGVGSNKERPLATAGWATAQDVARFAAMNSRHDGAALRLGFFPHAQFMATLDEARALTSAVWVNLARSGLPSSVKVEWQIKIEGAFARLYVDCSYPVPLNDDRHCLTFAGTRSGKGTSSLIPNLCLYDGSAFVLDPKGENAIITAERRGSGNSEWCEGMGQRVLVFDPYNVTKDLLPPGMQASFNPLDLLDPESDTFIEDTNAFADALIVPTEGKEDKHFDEMARRFIAAAIFYAFCFPQIDSAGQAISPDLPTVRKLLMQGDEDAAEAERSFLAEGAPPQDLNERLPVDPLKAMLRAMLRRPEFANGAMANDAGALLNTGDREFGGIVTTAARATAFIDSKMMQRVLRSSDFRPEQIKEAKEGMTVYVCVPPRFKATAAPWMRLFLTCCLNAFQKDLSPPANGKPTLFLLEEFAALGRMSVIEEALGYAAGFGILLWPVVQDYGQLERMYGKLAGSFVGNAGLVEFFGNGDNETAKLCSAMLGEVEISRQTMNVNYSESGNTSTPSDQQQLRLTGGGPLRTAFGILTSFAADARTFQEGFSSTQSSAEGLHVAPLLRPDEVKSLAARREYSKIAIPNGGNPMFLHRVDYYRDPRLRGRFRPLPHHADATESRQPACAPHDYDYPDRAAARANAAYADLMTLIRTVPEE